MYACAFPKTGDRNSERIVLFLLILIEYEYAILINNMSIFKRFFVGPVGIWIKIHLNPNLGVCLANHYLTESNVDSMTSHITKPTPEN
jgi:hypothetical protein